MIDVARIEQQHHPQAESAPRSPVMAQNASDQQPAEPAFAAGAASLPSRTQVNQEALAALEFNSSLNSVPSDVADLSPFPTILRRTSTAPVGSVGLQTIEDRSRVSRALPLRAASLPKCAEIDLGCETHYGFCKSSVRGVLEEILDEMATSTNLHTWDQKLFVSPLKALEKAVRRFLTERPDLDMTSVLTGTAVEMIANNRSSTVRKSPLHNDIRQMLFFTVINAADDEQDVMQNRDIPISTSHTASVTDRHHRGRIILLKDHVAPEERVILLLLLSLCIRFQDEDYAYIQAFMERHLTCKNNFSWPSQLQRMSPPQIESSRQRIYKRVTLSAHMNFLKIVKRCKTVYSAPDLDQETLFSYQKSDTEGNGRINIVRTTSSVLLTMGLLEVSTTNQEELDLLRLPQGFWTVMVVNCHERLARDLEREQTVHLTPLAQFLRGLTYSLCTQVLHAEAIYDQMKERLRTSDDETLFDDEHFTKSNLYHLIVKTCDELRESLMASQRYMRRAFDNYITQLCEDAHGSERLGLAYWKAKHNAEMHALEEIIAQIAALNASVQENRNALHGVTAVIEARVALQQGERIKILAYLATIYLPLTATSSLFSMSVLPSSATFWSFFVVLVAFFIGTALTALSLRPIVAGTRAKVQIKIPSNTLSDASARWPKLQWLMFILSGTSSIYHKSGLRQYVHSYVDLISPVREERFRWALVFEHVPRCDGICEMIVFAVPVVPFLLVRTWPRALVREALTREVMFLRDQYYLREQLDRNIPGLWWSPLALVRDVIRAIFVPIWVVLIAAIIVLLVVEDMLLGTLWLICFCTLGLCEGIASLEIKKFVGRH